MHEGRFMGTMRSRGGRGYSPRIAIFLSAVGALFSGSQNLSGQSIDRPARCEAIEGAVGVALMDSAGTKIIASATPAWTDSESIRIDSKPAIAIGVTHGDPAYEFGEVTAAVLMSDGRIVVADAQGAELKVYDSSGRHLRTVGRSGSGPGEYRRISALYRTHGDTLFVVDPQNQRITRLSPALETLSTTVLQSIPWVRPPSSYASQPLRGYVALQVKGMLDDGSLLATNARGGAQTPEVTNASRDTLVLRHVDPRLGTSDSLGQVVGKQWFQFFPGDGSFTFGHPPWGYVESLAVARNRYYYGTAETFEIEEHSPDGSLVRLIRVCEKPSVIDKRRLDDLIERYLRELPPEALRSQETALRGIPHPPTAPAYLRLLVDRAERLWVQRYTAPGMNELWRLLDREGRWLGTVQLPDGISPLDVAGDQLLARHTDELDVQTIRVFRISIPVRDK